MTNKRSADTGKFLLVFSITLLFMPSCAKRDNPAQNRQFTGQNSTIGYVSESEKEAYQLLEKQYKKEIDLTGLFIYELTDYYSQYKTMPSKAEPFVIKFIDEIAEKAGMGFNYLPIGDEPRTKFILFYYLTDQTTLLFFSDSYNWVVSEDF